MSVVLNLKHFGVKHCALLVGCLLAQQSAFARSDSDPIFFQAANLSSPDTFAVRSASKSEGEETSFAGFVPMANATSISALITRLEEEGDFYSPRIAELNEQLGRALQAEGEHHAALEAYDRSFHITRRQEGLFSASQASILQGMIRSQLALGDREASDALHQSLFLMQQQVFAEKPVALAEAYVTSADWNMKYYLQVRQTPVFGGRTTAQEAVLANRLGDAFMQYHNALWLFTTATADDLYEEKVAVERKIAAVTFMVNRQYQSESANMLTKVGQKNIHQSKRGNNPALLDHGSAALLRAIDYSKATAEPVLIAERELELADWYLLMNQQDEARTTYATAVALLRDAGVQEEEIATILESGQPVRNPETALLALAEDEAVGDFDGYVDVAFDLSRHGKASNARVLAGASYDEAVEKDVLRQIRDGRFRPGFDQGSPVDRTDVTLRYYFTR
jgi:tetratricopeptide (TPR) repeat protein